MRRLTFLLVASCGGPPPPPAHVEPPAAELVAEIGSALHLYTVTATGISHTREVPLPAPIRTIAWAHHAPVLHLTDDRVARVTAAGLEILPQPPSSTWKRAQPLPEATHRDFFTSRLITKGDEIWLAKCEWVELGLFENCRYWTDVRLDPTPHVTAIDDRSELEVSEPPKPPHPAAPSTAIDARLIPDQERHAGQRAKLHCTDGALASEDPPTGTPYEPASDIDTPGGRSDLVWLSTTPPIFQITDWDNCAPCPRAAIFERCQRSTRFIDPNFGPADLVAFDHPSNGQAPYAHDVTLLQRGHELAVLKNVTQFAFAPAP